MVTLLITTPHRPDPIECDQVVRAQEVDGRWQLECLHDVRMELATGAQIVDFEQEWPRLTTAVH